MSFAIDKFLPSGTYSIINTQLTRRISFNEQDECFNTSDDKYAWTITMLANKKWTIQGPPDVFADLAPGPEEGDDVASAKNPVKPHQWIIERHAEDPRSYRIYSPSEPGLLWSLPDGDEATSVQLSTDSSNASSLWKFEKIDDQPANVKSPDPMKLFIAAQVQRPIKFDSLIANTFAITVPVGWLAAITSVSYGECINLIRVRREVSGTLEKQDLTSGWDTIDKPMMVDGTNSDSLALSSTEDPYVLVVEAFHSRSRARNDPRKLPGLEDLSSSLRVITTSRPNDMKKIPDYQTFTIFDESSDKDLNAIITIHTSAVVTVDLEDPGKLEPGTVNNGYNEDLHRPRPSEMDQLLEQYRSIFVVDDSSAMAVGGAWRKAKDAVLRMTAEIMQYDADGIDIYFLNSLLYQDSITTPVEVVKIFSQITPRGSSPMGARLEFVLDKIMDQLEKAKDNVANYRQVKPVNIIVLTNSPPSDNPAKVIRSAARKLNEGLHHPNAVSIQFAQVGNDSRVEKALKKLVDDPSYSMVDSVSFGEKFTPETLQKAVLGAMHPSVRAQVAKSSSSQFLYYRVYNKDGGAPTKRPAYIDYPYIGRIKPKWIPPPRTAGSLRLCLSAMENMDASKTRLFLTSFSEVALADEMPISLTNAQIPGILPEEPLALVSEVIASNGLKPGTEALRILPDAKSPLTPRFIYYGMYTEAGPSTSKTPVDAEEPWVSRLDLDLVSPPLSVMSLMNFISSKEGLSGPCEVFADQGAMAPLDDGHNLVNQGHWPGSTTDDHMVFKSGSYAPPPPPLGWYSRASLSRRSFKSEMTSKIISQALPVPTTTPGIADIVGFGTAGIIILPNSVNSQARPVIANFGYDAGGWSVDKHVRLLGDTTGNGAADIIGFGEHGIWVSVNDGNSFQDPKLVIADFAYSAGGWRVEKHIRFVADITNTGRVDVIGFGDSGVLVSRNNGSGGFGPAQLVLPNFGYNQGWRLDKHLRFLADVTGDGFLDVIGFGEHHIFISRNNGDGTFKPPVAVVDSFCISAGGWQIDLHPRIVADLTGDGKADILGFGHGYVHVSLNNGNGTFGSSSTVNDFSYSHGWRVHKHPRFIADLTGNKRGDIVGFWDAGVYVALGNGDGTFQPAKLVIKDFGYDAGWRVEKHLRFVVDLTGSGCADIIGFGEDAVWVSYNDGNGNFGPVQKLTDDFGFSGGAWALDKTVRYVANLYT